jgi:hypothetical protein
LNWLLLGGSLAGVLALALTAWLLGLGGGAIGSPEEAMAIAEEGLGGFEAEQAIVSSDGRCALVFGGGGRIALIKQHGTQPAARMLGRPLRIEEVEGGFRVDSGERRFGAVRLLVSGDDRDKLLTMV